MSLFRPLGLCMAAAVLITPPALAAWKLDPAQSSLSFASIKKGNLGEVHHFTELSGAISASGAAEVVIKLASVETWADIRNERMRDFLFEVAKFPEARVTVQFDAATQKTLKALKPGAVTTVAAPVQLSLHGATQTLDVELVVARLSTTRVMVTTKDIIMLDAAKFNFGPGIQKIMELAELPSISTSVPVTFSLVFADKT